MTDLNTAAAHAQSDPRAAVQLIPSAEDDYVLRFVSSEGVYDHPIPYEDGGNFIEMVRQELVEELEDEVKSS